MKRIITLILALCMVATLAACGKPATTDEPVIETPNESVETTVPSDETLIPEDSTTVPEETTESTPTEEPVEDNTTTEIIDMGEAGQEIRLSELTPGTTYLFHVNEVQAEFFAKAAEGTVTGLDLHPLVYNDTDNLVVKLAIIVDDGELSEHDVFNEMNTVTLAAPLGNYLWSQSMSENPQPAKTLKLMYTPTTLSDEFIADNTINLSEWNVDETIDMNHRNYLLNDTESLLVIDVDISDGENSAILTYELEPSEVLEAHSSYKIKIVDIA